MLCDEVVFVVILHAPIEVAIATQSNSVAIPFLTYQAMSPMYVFVCVSVFRLYLIEIGLFVSLSSSLIEYVFIVVVVLFT